jgi:hypothetical protein
MRNADKNTPGTEIHEPGLAPSAYLGTQRENRALSQFPAPQVSICPKVQLAALQLLPVTVTLSILGTDVFQEVA